MSVGIGMTIILSTAIASALFGSEGVAWTVLVVWTGVAAYTMKSWSDQN